LEVEISPLGYKKFHETSIYKELLIIY
jgi:hypothetical protein